MSFEQLQSFVTVAELGCLTRAAERLHISQPPLTRKIRRLEDELGTPLFSRHPTGMRLLPAGEALLSHARHILGAVERARLELHAISRPRARTAPPEDPPERR